MDTGDRFLIALAAAFFLILACDAWFNDHNWITSIFLAVHAMGWGWILIISEEG